ncbi:hypothetical protein [Salinisphaera sp. G21_0]|uniref:hypothetical protein n=1 Tax=Salinisphaera sp. G21_0 TaxID=2821094 RepID=UPI001ADC27FD|nr:hypothetical protein [Salinisphaera sp. G21_0]MBO9484294.1 hypothetical protein [Salinisphaera sp. G21_0]
MYQYKDLREFREEYCQEITFKNVTIHGNADYKQELPNSFNVSLTPTSLKRLQMAWIAVTSGVDMSGTRIRSYDVKSSLSGHRVKDARILISQIDQNHVHCELQCFCVQSICCFISELRLHNSWFGRD